MAAALEAGQMTADTEKAFFSSIASAIFKYKKTPTTEDYIDVATVITQKYPFFKATSGKSYVSTSRELRGQEETAIICETKYATTE